MLTGNSTDLKKFWIAVVEYIGRKAFATVREVSGTEQGLN